MNSPRVGLGGTLSTIFWLSVLGLYVELLLIRWIGTEVRIFAYLQNTVLVVCFLGLGAGLFSSRREVNRTRMLAALAGLALALSIPVVRDAIGQISVTLSLVADVNIWYGASEIGNKAVIPLLVAAALVATLLLLIALI